MVDEFTFWRQSRAEGMPSEAIREAWIEYQRYYKLLDEIDAKKAEVEEAILRHVQATQDARGEPLESKGTG